jgi:hypothetical protein
VSCLEREANSVDTLSLDECRGLYCSFARREQNCKWIEHYLRKVFSTYLLPCQSASRFIFRSVISEAVTVAGDMNNPDPSPSR